MRILVLMLLAVAGSSRPVPTIPGDEAFARGEYTTAITQYDSMLALPTDSACIYWRLARVSVCMGDAAPDHRRESLYRRAETYARMSLRIDSMSSGGHTWLAAALGNIAMFVGGKTKVRLCNEIKRHLDRAIALDSTDDVAYSILGSFYIALGNVSWFERQLAAIFLGSLPEGGYEEALGALEKAIELAPRVIRHHFELATLYRAMGRNNDALREYEVTVQLSPVLSSDPRMQERAKEWISQLGG